MHVEAPEPGPPVSRRDERLFVLLGLIAVALGVAAKLLPEWRDVAYGLFLILWACGAWVYPLSETNKRPYLVGRFRTREDDDDLLKRTWVRMAAPFVAVAGFAFVIDGLLQHLPAK